MDKANCNGEEVVENSTHLEKVAHEDGGFCEPDLSEKMFCYCTICEEFIDIHVGIKYAMKVHMQSFHLTEMEQMSNSFGRNESKKSSKNGVEYETGSTAELVSSNHTSEMKSSLIEESKLDYLSDKTRLSQIEAQLDISGAVPVSEVLEDLTISDGIFATKNNSFFCYICDQYISMLKYVGHHIRSSRHRRFVQRYVEFSEMAKSNHVISIDPSIFVIREGKIFCTVCEIFLPTQHLLFIHLGEIHSQKIKLDFPIIRIGKLDFCVLCDVRINKKQISPVDHLKLSDHYINYLKVTTVVQLDNIKYCVLCSKVLSTDSQYECHLSGLYHNTKLPEIARNPYS